MVGKSEENHILFPKEFNTDNRAVFIEILRNFAIMANNSFQNRFKQLFLGLIVLFVLYIAFVLIHGTLYDYQPEAIIELEPSPAASPELPKDTLDLMIWNIGYAGLGAKQNFFYHGGMAFVAGGKTVQPRKDHVTENLSGIRQLIRDHSADIYLLQEVDIESKRSYNFNLFQEIGDLLPGYSSSFAPNYQVERVPVPLFQPWNAYGKMFSGLATYSRFQPSSVNRYQLPGRFSWPKRIFMLDRCLAVSRFSLENGKELILINLHNSAFDRKGKLKSQQTQFFSDFVQEEYKKGNYVIAGGDWNQSPPFFHYDGFMKNQDRNKLKQNRNIPEDLLPPDWIWAYDPTIPTNRSNRDTYVPGKTFVTLIDFFLLSPNVTLLKVKGIDHQFAWSDHQAVKVSVKLN